MILNKLLKAYNQESKVNLLLSNEIKKMEQIRMEIEKTEIKEIYVIFEMPIEKNKLIENIQQINNFVDKLKYQNKSKRFL